MSHAVLAASASERWMHCPPSARLALKYKDTGSTYAEEGSAAHALAERQLGAALEDAGIDVSWTGLSPDVMLVPGPEASIPDDSPYWKRDTALIFKYRDAAMDEYIAGYVAQVLERVLATKSPYVLLEQHLDFGDYVPHGYGTGDVVILSDDTLEIIDLKYGKGVPVDAHRNSQLMLYGLGALLTFGLLYDIQTVRVTVMQPRLDSASSYALSTDDLLQWAETEIKPAALLAWEGRGEFKTGDWCRFCPAAGDCRERARVNIELAQEAFTDPATLRDDEIGELLAQLPEWEAWAKAFRERALERALHEGARYSGFKLVLGRSTRKYTDGQAVIDRLTSPMQEEVVVTDEDGNEETEIRFVEYADHEISTHEPLGITAMTQLLGKKRFEQHLGDLITKAPGKPTLVPETDRRKEYVPETAKDVFKNFNDSADNETEKGD